ncbi:fimbria/pilus outer membrane usher protein [Enterobacter sp. C4G1]|uniref:fimbria/pilus outer membrane usher protein n=1 Tax=Enterobacter sp. C4G1 TaxID=3458724 RepID=UPI004068155F
MVCDRHGGKRCKDHSILYIRLAVHEHASTFAFSLLALSIVATTEEARAEDYFNPLSLEINAGDAQIDTEVFSKNGSQLPGRYLVDLYLNGSKVETREITFVTENGKLVPELTPAQLSEMGVRVNAFSGLEQLPADTPLHNINQFIPGVNSQFDFSTQRLDLNIPQAALTSQARGNINPALWEQGVPALLANYSFNGSTTFRNQSGNREDAQYFNLRSGANLGAWRFRNYSTWNGGSGKSQWQNVNGYLQRDIQFLKSQLTIGDGATSGDVFDSFQYRGIQLGSDDNMYPDSLKGFAPVVRGIARSNAQVAVRQNGYVIYQTYVPAGPFAFNDLYPTANSGDLEVTITEADGSEQRYSQPFSAVPVMLREGRLKYTATVGQYRSNTQDATTPTFGQTTLIYGLSNNYTLYGGTLFAENYLSQALGVGQSLGSFGSLSLDITHAKTRLSKDLEKRGQSVRFQYGKDIDATNTTFTLAGYRYSTRGFYDFNEANTVAQGSERDLQRHFNKRSRMQFNVSQSLKEYGNLYLNAYQQDFWGIKGNERSLSAGYNVTWNTISWGLSYTLNQSPWTHENDRQVAFQIQVPLGQWLPDSFANLNISARKNGSTGHESGISGTALEGNSLNYLIQQSYENRSQGRSGIASANYRGGMGQIRGAYSYAENAQTLNYGLDGGIVAHPYGITLSQPLGDNIVLVRAPGVSNIDVKNQYGVSTDDRGYAIVPYVSSYRLNRIALMTETLPDGVDIEENVLNVVPTKGAVVLADFKTRTGSRVLMNLTYHGSPVPFGATALLQQSKAERENSGIVGPDGQLYLSGMPQHGILKVQWGNDADQRCLVKFSLSSTTDSNPVQELDAMCLQG